MRTFPHIIRSLAIGAVSMTLVSGCFSYHKTETETPAQLAPAEPPGESTTTTTTTQSNDGSVRQHSTTTYAP
jgi:hypothetical protein